MCRKHHLNWSGLKLRVTIGCWCVTLEVLLLRSNLFAPYAPYTKKYASCVSPIGMISCLQNLAQSPPHLWVGCSAKHF